MDRAKRAVIARKLSDWYSQQTGTEPWLKVKNKKYVSMVSLLGNNSLNLKESLDVFKLFTLALNWNSLKYGRFHAGLNLFKKLDDAAILDSIFDRVEPMDLRINVDDKLICGYRHLRDKWDNIYPSLIGLTDSNIEKFILDLHKKFGKSEGTTPLAVKIFLILREMKAQRVLEITGDYCCVPDNNVREMMYLTGLSDRKWMKHPDIEEMIGISKEVSAFFDKDEYELYDMPLFWFYRTTCVKLPSCSARCAIHDLCLRRRCSNLKLEPNSKS